MSQYVTEAEFRTFGGLPCGVLDQLSKSALSLKLQAASDIADGYLRVRYTVPMMSPSGDLKIRVAMIAAYLVMAELGFNPDATPDQIITKNYDDSVRWLEQVSKGHIVPVSTSDQTPAVEEYSPEVSSDSLRGW